MNVVTTSSSYKLVGDCMPMLKALETPRYDALVMLVKLLKGTATELVET